MEWPYTNFNCDMNTKCTHLQTRLMDMYNKFNANKFELLRYGKEQEIKSATTYKSYDDSNIDNKEHVRDLGIMMSIEYCCQLWNPWKAKDIQSIEAIQRTFTYKISEVQHLNYWEDCTNSNCTLSRDAVNVI